MAYILCSIAYIYRNKCTLIKDDLTKTGWSIRIFFLIFLLFQAT